MKKVLTVMACMLMTLASWAHDVEIDGLYYNLDEENKTDVVTIVPVADEVHHAEYTVVQDDIEVKVSKGSVNPFNFICEAGNTITISAPKNIKGIVFDGQQIDVWKATVSSGNLTVLDKYNTVSSSLAVLKDVDSNTVTITSSTDIIINSIDIYFDEDPDVELGMDLVTLVLDREVEDGVDSHYDINRIAWNKYGEKYCGREDITEVFMYADEQNAFFEILLFSPWDTETCVKPGVYSFDYTGNQGTAYSSFGYILEDGCPCLSIGVINASANPDWEDWTAFDYLFITGGTISFEKVPEGVKIEFDVTTAKGKHITASYVGSADPYDTDDPTGISMHQASKKLSTATKHIKNGKLIIEKNGCSYNSVGQKLRITL